MISKEIFNKSCRVNPHSILKVVFIQVKLIQNAATVAASGGMLFLLQDLLHVNAAASLSTEKNTHALFEQSECFSDDQSSLDEIPSDF